MEGFRSVESSNELYRAQRAYENELKKIEKKIWKKRFDWNLKWDFGGCKKAMKLSEDALTKLVVYKKKKWNV